MNTIAGLIKKSDISLMYLFNRRIHCNPLNLLLKQITHLGSTTFSALLVIALFVYAGHGARLISRQLMITLILSQVIVQTIKRIVNRPRPYIALQNILPINPPTCKYSLPSGHTCAAFTIAIILAINLPAYSSIFILLALMVGVSRVYLGVHYPTDVMIGFMIAYVNIKIVMVLGFLL